MTIGSMQKPYVQACENNKHAIADALQNYLRNVKNVLEIGSGTGQHIVYFAERFPDIKWQPSDIVTQHEGIRAWIDAAGAANVVAPIELDIAARAWRLDDVPLSPINAVYLSNVVHIMESKLIKQLFAHLKQLLCDNGLVFMYGPFNYDGRFTSEGNRRLDAWLKAQNTDFGVRDFERVDEIAREHGFCLLDDLTMPANNRLLVWRAFS